MLVCSLTSNCYWQNNNPTLSRQGAALAYLDSLPPHNLVFWTEGSVPFPFYKGSSGVLVNGSLCGTETTLSFSPASTVSSSFSAEACAILQALCWSRQHQQVGHFFSPPLVTLIHFSFYLNRSCRNYILSPPVLSGYSGFLDTRFSREMTRLMSGSDGSAARALYNHL